METLINVTEKSKSKLSEGEKNKLIWGELQNTGMDQHKRKRQQKRTDDLGYFKRLLSKFYNRAVNERLK